jgi:phenylpropionate dioxygenase-like ring-hydroxylating dioxygenase large terminal subunit
VKRDELVRIAKQLLDYVESGTTASHEDGPRRNPISTYTDPEQFELEKARILGRFPQLICLSSDMPDPGDFRTHDDTGVPMLLVRNREGRVQAFLNACSHRAARLVEGEGNAKRSFVCPYHAWSYGLDGRCTGIHKRETFGDVSPADFRLLELPCEEKYGFVYAAPAPDAHFTIDDHLGELGPQLGSWDLGAATFVDSWQWNLQSNWKLALDTFCEGYHFQPLHPDTIAATSFTNTMSYDRYGGQGEHHRLGFPRKSIALLRELPEHEWEPLDHFSFVHFLFPNISLLVSPNAVELFQLFPGRHVGEHTTRYRSYMRQPLDSDEKWEEARTHFRRIRDVVTSDDYWVSANIQKNFNAGLATHTHYGRNEPSLINMHRTFRRMAGLSPVDEPLERAEQE